MVFMLVDYLQTDCWGKTAPEAASCPGAGRSTETRRPQGSSSNGSANAGGSTGPSWEKDAPSKNKDGLRVDEDGVIMDA